MISLLEDGKRCMAVAQFGIYKAVAVLNLEPQNSATTKDHIPIKGTYYYVKHAKKILNNLEENSSKNIQVTHPIKSYK